MFETSLKYSGQTGFVIVLLWAPTKITVGFKNFVSPSVVSVLEECPLGQHTPRLSGKPCLRLFSGTNVDQQPCGQSTHGPPNLCHLWFPEVSELPHDGLR